MGTKKEELAAIAVEQGYDGPTPTTIAGAVDALTTALGGEPSGGTIAQAVHALAPNIGGGGSEGLDIGNIVDVNIVSGKPNGRYTPGTSDTHVNPSGEVYSAIPSDGGKLMARIPRSSYTNINIAEGVTFCVSVAKSAGTTEATIVNVMNTTSGEVKAYASVNYDYSWYSLGEVPVASVDANSYGVSAYATIPHFDLSEYEDYDALDLTFYFYDKTAS